MSESKDEQPRERPHGHRDRGRIDESPRKEKVDSATRTQGPDPANPEGDETVAYPKGR